MTSKIDFTKGPTRAASAGRTSLQFNEFNILMVVDDQGVAVPLTSTGVTSHPALTERADPDQHPIGAITSLQGILDQLQTDLTGAENNITSMQLTLIDHQTQIDDNLIITNAKEDDLGVPIANDYILQSDIAGIRTWVPHQGVGEHNDLIGREFADCHTVSSITGLIGDLGDKVDHVTYTLEQGIQDDAIQQNTDDIANIVGGASEKIFCAYNEVTQSHNVVAEQLIEWDAEVFKHGTHFLHDVNVNPEEITILYTGYLAVSFNLSFENDELKDQQMQARIFLNGAHVPHATVYGWSKKHDNINCVNATMAGIIIPVTTNDVLTVVTRVSENTIQNLGMLKDVVSRYQESVITLKTIVE